MANILVVDDSVMMRKNIKQMLEDEGHKVIAEAGDGNQAYLAYANHKPDIVTLDITMPKEDGVSTVKRIASDFPNAKIIMISALNQKNIVYDALKSGAKNYIVKPINKQKLLFIIDKVLKK